MFARMVVAKLKPGVDVKAAAPDIERQVLSLMAGQKGFSGAMSFISPDGNEGVAVSFWATKPDLDEYVRTAAPQVLAAMGQLFDDAPVAKTYEVAASTLHRTATSA